MRQLMTTAYLSAWVILALLCLSTFALAAPKSKSEDDLVFAVIGDWGLVGDQMQIKVAEAMDAWVGESGASCVVSMGDNFYPDGVESVDDPQWDLAWRDVYLTLPNLSDKRWYITLGNKDSDGNEMAQVEYGQLEELWYLPDLWHTWTMNAGDQTVQFISIHTKVIDDEYHQIIWFTKTIVESTADWIIVCMHHPIMSAGKNGNRDRSKWIIEHVEPLVEEYKVALVLQGHDHNLQHINRTNSVTEYVTSGAGHDLNPQDEDATEFVEKDLGGTIQYFGQNNGFVGIRISGNTATVQYFNEEGEKEHEFVQENPRARK